MLRSSDAPPLTSCWWELKLRVMGPKQQYTHDVSRLHLVKIWINIATITVFV